jgi:PKD repeat protein
MSETNNFSVKVSDKYGNKTKTVTFTPSLAAGYESPNCYFKFGDGQYHQQESLNPVRHTYQAAGTYIVLCTCEYYRFDSTQNFFETVTLYLNIK